MLNKTRMPTEHALCLNPFLCMLDDNLSGIRLRHHSKKTTVVAYADDVTILVTSPNDIQLIKDAITCCQEASGAQINLGKSKARRWVSGTHQLINGHTIPQCNKNPGCPNAQHNCKICGQKLVNNNRKDTSTGT
jgi:hypothetical protein